MKIKRFFSHDMRSVIRKVRDELGSDAVILSNNKVNGGVEIVAAIDYDDSLLENKNLSDNELEATKNNSVIGTEKDILLSSPVSEKNVASRELLPRNKYIIDNDGCEELPIEKQQSNKINNKVENDYGQSETESSYTFYRLDKSNDESSTVNETLYSVAAKENLQSRSKATIPVSHAEESVWSQEPTLVSMRNEITTLRSLLEQQLSGLAWGDIARKNPLKAKLLRQLIQIDFSPELAKQISETINENLEYEHAWQAALNYVADRLQVSNEDFTVTGGVIALIGTTGVGKTTTIAKLAARYALRHGRDKVALITTDGFRIGAHEQLRTYGRILGIPMRVANNKNELQEAVNSFQDKKFVLIDTAGMSQRDARLSNQIAVLDECIPDLKKVLVLSSTTHRLALQEIVENFDRNEIHSCIITKSDETTNLGGAISVVCQFQLPIAYVCDGQKVPEDIHQARANSLVNRTVLIARHANQSTEDELMELAINRMSKNVSV